MTIEKQNDIWFDALMKVAVSEALKNEMDMLPSKEELNDEYVPSIELDLRIKRIIIRDKVNTKMKKYTRVIRKMAVSIIIILAASSITLLSVEATRNAIFNAFIERFRKYTEIKFMDSSTSDKQSDIYHPTYLPKGFKETSTQTYGNTVMIIYSDDADIEIKFKQRPADTGTSLIDNENKEYKEVNMNGNTAYLFEAIMKDDYNVLIWQSEGIVFELTSLISSDELIHIGSSIKNN